MIRTSVIPPVPGAMLVSRQQDKHASALGRRGMLTLLRDVSMSPQLVSIDRWYQ
jgi:hypothetical protein